MGSRVVRANYLIGSARKVSSEISAGYYWLRFWHHYQTMDPSDREIARAAILEVIENQLRDNNPPETRATLERLLHAGHSRAEAMRLIACALANEMFSVLKSDAPYDNARYIASLERLPELPWDEK